MAEWVKVAQVDEVPPGQAKLVRAGEQFIALYNCGGELYATDDTCSHAEASLSDGFLQDYEIECPEHGARFDVRTGAATWSPAVIPVATYAVRVEGTNVLIDPEPRRDR